MVGVCEFSSVSAMPVWFKPACSKAVTVSIAPSSPWSSTWFDAVEHASYPMSFRSSTRDVGALNLGYPDNWERLEVNGVSRWQMARSAELIRSATLANRGRKSCLRSVPSAVAAAAAALITGEWGIRSPVNNKVAFLGGVVVVVVVVIEVVVVEGAAVVVVSSVVVTASRAASVEVVVTGLTLLPHALTKK